MNENKLSISPQYNISNIGKIYCNVLFDVGEFIYLDDSQSSPPRYRKATNGRCDFLVVGRGSNYFEVIKSGFIELNKYSKLGHLGKIRGSVYIDSNGLISTKKTSTRVGYVDNGIFYLEITSDSEQFTTSKKTYEYSSKGSIIDSGVYFSADLSNDYNLIIADITDAHLINEDCIICGASLSVNGLGVKADSLILPAYFVVSLMTQYETLGDISYELNSNLIGTYYPADCNLFSSISDLSIRLNKGDLLYVKFTPNSVLHSVNSNISYYGCAKILIETTTS